MKTNKKPILLIIGIAIVVLLAMLIIRFRSTGPMDLVVAIPRVESNALIWIAQDRGFFRRNGLNVTLHESDTGIAGLDQLSKGEVDIAGTAEFPMVGKTFKKERNLIIGCADKADYIFLVGRKDKGIKKVSDLKGKRFGIIPRTINAFYLGRFLDLNGMDIKDVTIVYVKNYAEVMKTIIAGSVDATIIVEPHASSIKDRLGTNAVVWRAQSGQYLYGLLVSTEEWVKKHPDLVIKFLRSLDQAEDYLFHNPGELEIIEQKWLNVDAERIPIIWSENQFSLSLDESLIAAMEDEARWMIKSNLTKEKEMPNFLDYIYTDGLEAVKPEAVNIIR